MSREVSFVTALLSGGVAGTSVDVVLYPLDTIKTRLQSPQGFLKAGGFRGVYKGLSAAAAGSAPGAALFFSTYEFMKTTFRNLSGSMGIMIPEPMIHMSAASCGEVAACLVRVPTEVVKQRMQTGMYSSFRETVSSTYKSQGLMGFYQGFGTTIMREIPFAFIQFPIYEALKVSVKKIKERNGSTLYSIESACCGSFSGGIAAALTTPLDVIKTRLMLGADSHGVQYRGFVDTFQRLCAEGAGKAHGPKSVFGSYSIFFSGVQPRVMWISIGGFVFFGAYEQSVYLLQNNGFR